MINIITGHYGSGKTEFAINLALKKMSEGKKVTICDLDIVNPYFRTSDVKNFLSQKGINVIASEFASSNVDIPVLPGEILSVFADSRTEAVLDVGGDEDGAVALGGFFNYIKNREYRMFFVINTLRPMTANEDDILESVATVENCAQNMGVPVTYISGRRDVLKNLPENFKDKLFTLETFMNLPF